MSTTTYMLAAGGIKKLLRLTEKFHTTDILVQALPPRDSIELKPPANLHNATISDGRGYLPALFTNLDEHQLEDMYFCVCRIKVALLCPFPLEDLGFCNILVIQSFEKCGEPLNGIIGKPVDDFSPYRDESFPIGDVVPIAVLSLFPVSSCLPPIRARVTYKSRLNDPYHSRLCRPSFVVHLMDESSEIRAYVDGWLTQIAGEIYDRLQEGKIYYLSNLNLADTGSGFESVNFSNLKNEAHLSLTRATVIEECTIDTNLPAYTFNLATIPQLTQMELTIENPGNHWTETQIYCSVDVIGIISEVSLIDDGPIHRPAVRVPFRYITIFDQSGIILSVVLWFYHAEEFTARPGDIIAIRNARLIDFPSGFKLLERHPDVAPHRVVSVVTTSTIHIEPDIKECFALRHWYNTTPPEWLEIWTDRE